MSLRKVSVGVSSRPLERLRLVAVRTLRGDGRTAQEHRDPVGRVPPRAWHHADLTLMLVGRSGWGGMSEPRDLGSHVRHVGQVSDEELARLYVGASCLVMPSLYEGFGLPLLEAMAVGTPAVVSDILALRELGGNTVRYANPHDPAALARAIEAALEMSRPRACLAERARLRAHAYRWTCCASSPLRLPRGRRFTSGKAGSGAVTVRMPVRRVRDADRTSGSKGMPRR